MKVLLIAHKRYCIPNGSFKPFFAFFRVPSRQTNIFRQHNDKRSIYQRNINKKENLFLLTRGLRIRSIFIFN